MATNVQVYRADAGWAIRAVGDDETSAQVFQTRQEAETAGRRLAEELGGELLVHDESGETEKKEDHGDG